MKEDIINFIEDFSVELNPKVQKKISDIHINKKNKIFITYLPESDEKEIFSAVEFVNTKGFIPVVHLPARTMRDIKHVEDFLITIRKLTKSNEILVIGGGGSQVGFINSSVDILESGLLEKYDFNKVKVAGHPEGSPDINNEILKEFLLIKEKIHTSKELDLEIVTQFFFESDPFIKWDVFLDKIGVTLPVRVGFPGPATFKTLLNFGLMSGVGNSLNFLKKNSNKIGDLLAKTSNDKMLIELATASKLSKLGRPNAFHCYPFGGFEKTCHWLTAIQNGDFIVENDKLIFHKKKI
ncbi:MAG: methylenetetrahydrofolate reductase [Proteobacteria bacterium]|nr:methylenetetrahydrofolate reductase [Pseudomonadota bacterium]